MVTALPKMEEEEKNLQTHIKDQVTFINYSCFVIFLVIKVEALGHIITKMNSTQEVMYHRV